MLTVKLGRMVVDVDQRTLEEALDILLVVLTKVGADGDFTAVPIRKVRMRGPSPFRLSSPQEHHLITVIRPGNNDTTWEWRITPPHMTSVHKLHIDMLAAVEELDSSRFNLRSDLALVKHTADHPVVRDLALIKKRPLPSETVKGNSGMSQATSADTAPDNTGDELQSLAKKVLAARSLAKDYTDREASLKRFEGECEAAAQAVLQAEQEIKNQQKAHAAAQGQYDKAKKFFESVRIQHLADVKGREAAQLLKTLDNL